MPAARFSEINPNRLYQFQIIADLGSAAKACAYLGISAPALAQNISRLEAELGTQLFDRTTRPPRLTMAGHHLLDYVRKMQIETEALFERLDLEQGGFSSIIRIGCGARWMVDIMPRVIGTFNQRYPSTRLAIRVGQMDVLADALETRQISLLFGTTTAMRRFNHHDVMDVGVDRFAIVARREHPLHGRRNLALEDLVNERWIIGDPSTSSTMVLRQLLRERGLAPIIPAVELSDTLAVANTMRSGDFLGIFTTATVRNLEHIEALSLGFELPETKSGVIRLSTHILSEAESAFVDEVRRAFG